MSTKLSKKLERINSSVSKIRQKTNMPDAVIEDLAIAVESMVTPEGSITITENSTVDVSNYAEAIVNVAGGGSSTKSNIYKVSTIEERDAITDVVDGDICVVYYSNISNATVDSEFQKAKFPNIVVLPEAVTDFIEFGYRPIDPNIMTEVYGNLDSSRFRMSGHTESSHIEIEYTSEDGITYTRTDGGNEEIDFGTIIRHDLPEIWNDAIGYFVQLGSVNFDGLFEYKNNSWEYANIGITLFKNDILKGKVVYTSNGLLEGDLASDISKDTLLKINNILNDVHNIPLPSNCNRLFYNTNLNNYLIMKNLDTSLVTNISNMFDQCHDTIYIPLFDTSNVTNMDYAFQACNSITELPCFNTSNVTSMNNTFGGCRSLKEIPNIDTSNVIDMEGTFKYCSSLTKIPNIDTSKVKNMSSTFSNCSSLTTVPNLNTSNVTDMGSTFSNCSSLTTVPNFDTSNVLLSNFTFLNDTSLVSLPKFNFSKAQSLEGFVRYCTNLVDFPLLNCPKLVNIDRIVKDCPNLSDESLNNILLLAISATKIGSSERTATKLGLNDNQRERIKSLPAYNNFISAGWSNS